MQAVALASGDEQPRWQVSLGIGRTNWKINEYKSLQSFVITGIAYSEGHCGIWIRHSLRQREAEKGRKNRTQSFRLLESLQARCCACMPSTWISVSKVRDFLRCCENDSEITWVACLRLLWCYCVKCIDNTNDYMFDSGVKTVFWH